MSDRDARTSTPRSIGPGEPNATPPRVPSVGARAGDEAMSAVLAANWWALAVRGIAAILLGVIALFFPGAALLSFALLFAAYLLVDGVFGIVSAIRAGQRNERWGLLLAEGVLNLLMGAVAFLFPVGAVLAFVLVTAAWSLVTGALMLAAAFKLTEAHGRWWMVLSGVVSVSFGVLLVLAPLIGAVVLTWWLGGYAIAFGIMLLVLAFKLRGQRDSSPGVGATAPQGT